MATHRLHGRAQFAADDGEKIGLGRVGRFRSFAKAKVRAPAGQGS